MKIISANTDRALTLSMILVRQHGYVKGDLRGVQGCIEGMLGCEGGVRRRKSRVEAITKFVKSLSQNSVMMARMLIHRF